MRSSSSIPGYCRRSRFTAGSGSGGSRAIAVDPLSMMRSRTSGSTGAGSFPKYPKA